MENSSFLLGSVSLVGEIGIFRGDSGTLSGDFEQSRTPVSTFSTTPLEVRFSSSFLSYSLKLKLFFLRMSCRTSPEMFFRGRRREHSLLKISLEESF